MSVRSADLSGVSSAVARARDAALGVLAETVVADCAPLVPVRTGALRGSGEAEVSGGGSATVTWGGDADTARYARAQYYGVGLSHATAANVAAGGQATDHWFDKARAVRLPAWERAYAKTLKGGLR